MYCNADSSKPLSVLEVYMSIIYRIYIFPLRKEKVCSLVKQTSIVPLDSRQALSICIATLK